METLYYIQRYTISLPTLVGVNCSVLYSTKALHPYKASIKIINATRNYYLEAPSLSSVSFPRSTLTSTV